METRSQEPSEAVEPVDKWNSWHELNSPVAADRYLRSIGIELHAGSTKEEIDRAVRVYRASW